jgi:hypothetical protein
MIDVRVHEVGTRDGRGARRDDQFPSLRHTNSPLALM